MQNKVLNRGVLVVGGGGALSAVNPLTGEAMAIVAEAKPDRTEAATFATRATSGT